MGMIKKDTTAVPGTEVAPGAVPKTVESGLDAAVARLQQSVQRAEAKAYVPKVRDFDAEARGKTRCVQFEAALKSPAIAGMKFNTMEEFLGLVRKAADYGVAYTFCELDPK